MKKIINILGIGIVGIIGATLALSAVFYMPLMLPFVDNVMTDINIAATREGLYGPYVYSNLRDRWEILHVKAFGLKATKSKFPPRQLKPLNPDLPPWVNLSPEQFKAEIIKIGVKIGMPVMAVP